MFPNVLPNLYKALIMSMQNSDWTIFGGRTDCHALARQ